MSHESTRAGTAWTDRLEAVPNWAALTSVVVAVFVGIHGAVHVLVAPTGHLQVSMQGVLIVLWGLTTLVALGGLAALGGAYTSLASRLDNRPQFDIEILPEGERRILKPILGSPGVTQVESSHGAAFPMRRSARR